MTNPLIDKNAGPEGPMKIETAVIEAICLLEDRSVMPSKREDNAIKTLRAALMDCGMKYTVVLAIPKYMTDGQEQSWCATVNAQNPIEAVQHAQKQVAKELDRPNCVEDFLPISIFEGEHEDLIGKWAD